MAQPPLILLIDDDPNDEELARIALRRSAPAHRLEVINDASSAVQRVVALCGDALSTPQLVLLDLKMPKVGGLELLRRLRAHPATRLLPVVVFTSSVEARDVAASYEQGANSYIRKPVDYAAYTNAIGEIGAYWLTRNLPPPTARESGPPWGAP